MRAPIINLLGWPRVVLFCQYDRIATPLIVHNCPLLSSLHSHKSIAPLLLVPPVYSYKSIPPLRLVPPVHLHIPIHTPCRGVWIENFSFKTLLKSVNNQHLLVNKHGYVLYAGSLCAFLGWYLQHLVEEGWRITPKLVFGLNNAISNLLVNCYFWNHTILVE